VRTKQASSIPTPLTLHALRERLAAVEHRAHAGASVSTGWGELDAAFTTGGLQRGCVHEWLGLASATWHWSPPLGVLLHLVRQSIDAANAASAPLTVCWIGRRAWPTAHALATADGTLLSRSLFVDAGDAPARLWVSDLAARCPSVLVIADGSKFDMAASRRLQLAVEAGGWMVHLARPPWEAKEISAATTRWRIARDISPANEPRFQIELLRSKGIRSSHAQDRTFTLQRDSRARLVLVSPPVADRSHAAKIAG